MHQLSGGVGSWGPLAQAFSGETAQRGSSALPRERDAEAALILSSYHLPLPLPEQQQDIRTHRAWGIIYNQTSKLVIMGSKLCTQHTHQRRR